MPVRAVNLVFYEPVLYRWEDRFVSLDYIKPAGGDWGTPHMHTFLHRVPTVAEAQYVQFLCPACYRKNNGPVGTHMVGVGFSDRGLLDHQGSRNSAGEPSRWAVSGDRLDNLTLSPSIDCKCWHGFVTNGEVTNV